MEKTTMIAAALVFVLVIGAVFVSANILKEDAEIEAPVCQTESGQCNNANCNTQCGGTCSVPICGCGR